MHTSAYRFGELFHDCYFKEGMKVAEIGSQNVNGSIRDFFSDAVDYTGVDFVEGTGVDVVLSDPYKLPFDDNSFDMILSSSCFEHSEFFWLSFLEIIRTLKPGGVFYLNVPSNGFIHRYPVDCWRFYPDSGRALANWANRNGIDVELLESFIGGQIPGGKFGAPSGRWNDFVAVFVKGKSAKNNYKQRIFNVSDIPITHLTTDKGLIEETGSFQPEDFNIIDSLNKANSDLKISLKNYQEQTDSLKFEAEKYKSEAEKYKPEAERYQSEAERYQSDIERYQSDIERYNFDVNHYKSINSELTLSVKKSQSLLEQNETTLACMQAEANKLHSSIKSEQNKNVLAEKNLKNKELRLLQLHTAYVETLNSKTWRYTKPIRRFFNYFNFVK